MTEHRIKPAGAITRSIDIQYSYHGLYRINILSGLRLKDKDANTLLECGVFNPPDSTYINHTMVVDEGERIVAMRSKTWRNFSGAGMHCDIEFLLSN